MTYPDTSGLRRILIGLFRSKGFENDRMREAMQFVFSSTLRGTNKFCFVPEKWQGGAPSDWPGHDYWTPNVPLEWGVWEYFERCYKKLVRGKSYTKQEIGNYCGQAMSFRDLDNGNATCWLLAKSATDLKEIPNESIDVIITDTDPLKSYVWKRAIR